jgi:hypothetical protein
VDTSFQSLNQLAVNISKNIESLSNGQLNNDQIEKLTSDTRELYERMIVIRHKMYEKFGKSESTAKSIDEVKEIEPKKEEEIIDFSEPEKEPEIEMMSFDFSEPEPLIEEKTEEVTEVITETTIEEKITITEETTTTLSESINTENHSLNDVFKSTGSNSLADKLNQTAIQDLKSNIDINKKFKFINELFNGSNENYNAAIEELNNCSDADIARSKLTEMSSSNNWDVESDAVGVFVQLIERRYS